MGGHRRIDAAAQAHHYALLTAHASILTGRAFLVRCKKIGHVSLVEHACVAIVFVAFSDGAALAAQLVPSTNACLFANGHRYADLQASKRLHTRFGYVHPLALAGKEITKYYYFCAGTTTMVSPVLPVRPVSPFAPS